MVSERLDERTRFKWRTENDNSWREARFTDPPRQRLQGRTRWWSIRVIRWSTRCLLCFRSSLLFITSMWSAAVNSQVVVHALCTLIVLLCKQMSLLRIITKTFICVVVVIIAIFIVVVVVGVAAAASGTARVRNTFFTMSNSSTDSTCPSQFKRRWTSSFFMSTSRS